MEVTSVRSWRIFPHLCFSQSEPCLITSLTGGGGNKRRASHVIVVPSRTSDRLALISRNELWLEKLRSGRRAGGQGKMEQQQKRPHCRAATLRSLWDIDLPASRAQLPYAPDPKQQGWETDSRRGGETLAERPDRNWNNIKLWWSQQQPLWDR